MTIGDRIRKRREMVGISQTELAEKIGVSKQTLYKYESNIVTNIPSDKIEFISKVLDVSPAYLMGWEKPSVEDVEFSADLIGNPLLLKYVKKIYEMNYSDREKIFSYIDYISSK